MKYYDMADGGGDSSTNASAPAVVPAPVATPVVNGQAALAKLTGGQTLTDAEKAYLGLGPAVSQPPKDPNEGRTGYHLDSATGTWVPDQGSNPAGKTLLKSVDNGDGTFTLYYSDKSQEVIGTKKTTTETPVGPTLAKDVFKQTLATYFGQAEASKPWMDELYNLSAPLYKSGATMDEALNMALLQGRNNPALADFTNRFKGVFALQDAKVAGKAVNVPTIAQYYAAEAGMGNVLQQAGLGELATQDYLGNVIGKGLSVTDVGNYINDIYTEIQNLPTDIKDSVTQHYPAADNVSIAKAILTGDKGFAQLQKDLTTYEIQAASQKQGLGTYDAVTGKYSGLNDQAARDLASGGYNLTTATQGLGQVAIAAPTYQKLTEISGGKPVSATQSQSDVINALMNKNAAAQLDIARQQELERGRFAGSAGRLASRDRAQGLI